MNPLTLSCARMASYDLSNTFAPFQRPTVYEHLSSCRYYLRPAQYSPIFNVRDATAPLPYSFHTRVALTPSTAPTVQRRRSLLIQPEPSPAPLHSICYPLSSPLISEQVQRRSPAFLLPRRSRSELVGLRLPWTWLQHHDDPLSLYLTLSLCALIFSYS